MSKPDEFPADVWTAAENALDDMLCNCREASGGTEAFRNDSITDIARAILSERNAQIERDALLADQCAQERFADGDPEGSGVIEDLAQSIRSQLTGGRNDRA